MKKVEAFSNFTLRPIPFYLNISKPIIFHGEAELIINHNFVKKPGFPQRLMKPVLMLFIAVF